MTYHGQTHVNHGITLLYTTVFTHSRSPTSRHTHTHTQIVTHQSVFTTTPLVKPHDTISYSMTYHIQTHVNHGIPLLYTTVFTHSRSPTSRHTHTYTDS